jgi:hypothetical protein
MNLPIGCSRNNYRGQNRKRKNAPRNKLPKEAANSQNSLIFHLRSSEILTTVNKHPDFRGLRGGA